MVSGRWSFHQQREPANRFYLPVSYPQVNRKCDYPTKAPMSLAGP